MDWSESVLLLVVMNLATTLLGAASQLFLCLFARLHVEESVPVSVLDQILSARGWCSARRLGPGRLPADGVHLLFPGSSEGLKWPAFAVRQTTEGARGGTASRFCVYALTAADAKALGAALSGAPSAICLCYVYAPCPWRTSTNTMRAAPPGPPRAWQAKAVTALLERFASQGRAAALVCGGPGAGKSTLGEFLAVRLKGMGREPVVVKNLDLTAKGLLLEDVFATPTPGFPVILMLDEFDATVAHAEGGKDGDKEGRSLAATPTSLLTVLDLLNRMDNLVVIATTNRTAEEVRSGVFQRYTRRGRLDLHVAAAAEGREKQH